MNMATERSSKVIPDSFRIMEICVSVNLVKLCYSGYTNRLLRINRLLDFVHRPAFKNSKKLLFLNFLILDDGQSPNAY
jgi:hypothetical protein